MTGALMNMWLRFPYLVEGRRAAVQEQARGGQRGWLERGKGGRVIVNTKEGREGSLAKDGASRVVEEARQGMTREPAVDEWPS